MTNSTQVFERLLEVLGVKNLDEAAVKLDMNPNTFRGRKSRGAVPYAEIIEKLNSCDLIYVLKGERIQTDSSAHAMSNSEKRTEEVLERFSVGLIEKIENSPFSREAKLQMIDSLLRIIEKDLNEEHPAKKNEETVSSDSSHGVESHGLSGP